MDEQELKQNIAKYYSLLPVEAQKFFSDMKWMAELQNIATKYGLKGEQIQTLGTETTLLLLALLDAGEYREILEKELNLPKEIFNQLFDEINFSILNDNYKHLEQAFGENALALANEKYGGGKTLDERFSALPIEVQKAINESNYQVTLYTLAEKYKLNIEQMGILEEMTTKVMLNVIHPDQYENELTAQIKIPREDISNLVKDVNEGIFKAIREKEKDDSITNYELRITNEKKEKVITNDDAVPLPPYAKVITNDEKEKAITNYELRITNEANDEIPKNIIEEKLKGPVVSERVVSDHTAPKINDPYHEAI